MCYAHMHCQNVVTHFYVFAGRDLKFSVFSFTCHNHKYTKDHLKEYSGKEITSDEYEVYQIQQM